MYMLSCYNNSHQNLTTSIGCFCHRFPRATYLLVGSLPSFPWLCDQNTILWFSSKFKPPIQNFADSSNFSKTCNTETKSVDYLICYNYAILPTQSGYIKKAVTKRKAVNFTLTQYTNVTSLTKTRVRNEFGP